jgi:hypothetical protein
LRDHDTGESLSPEGAESIHGAIYGVHDGAGVGGCSRRVECPRGSASGDLGTGERDFARVPSRNHGRYNDSALGEVGCLGGLGSDIVVFVDRGAGFRGSLLHVRVAKRLGAGHGHVGSCVDSGSLCKNGGDGRAP